MFSDARNDHAAIGMAHEDDLIEIFPLDLVDDVVDVGGEIDIGVEEVRTLTQTGQGICLM